MELGPFVLPLEKSTRNKGLYTSAMTLNAHVGQGLGVAMHVRDDADLRHRRLGHIGAKGFDHCAEGERQRPQLRRYSTSLRRLRFGLEEAATIPQACQLQHQQALPPRVQRHNGGSFTPTGFSNYRYVSKITDQHTKQRAVYLAKVKSGALLTIQHFV